MPWRPFPLPLPYLSLLPLAVLVIAGSSLVYQQKSEAQSASPVETAQPAQPTAATLVTADAIAEASLILAAQPAATANADFEHGYALLRNGDYGGADATFAPYANSQDPALAAEALFRRGEAAVKDERYQDALDALSALRDRYPGTQQAGEGALLLGLARRGQGDCAGAISAFQAAAQERPLIAATAHALEAECDLALDQPNDVIAAEQTVLDANPPRMQRLEALEHQAESYLRLGNQDAALDIYGRLLGESRTRSYTAELLYTVGIIHRDAGRTDRAVERLTSVVVDYPESARAGDALDALNAMGASDPITWYQAGLARLNQGRLSDAVSAFSRSLEEDPQGADAPAATYYRGSNLVRLDDTENGLADLTSVPDRWPRSEFAPRALLRAGQALEEDGRFQDAADTYTRLTTDYPSSAAAGVARFRFGLTLYARGADDQALSAWSDALGIETQPDARAQLLLWRGKSRARAGDADGARVDWQAAEQASPISFGGLRAGELLAGDAHGVAWPAASVSAGGEDPDLAGWLQSVSGADADTLEARVSAEPGFQRADALLRLAQRTRARWEVTDLVEAHAKEPGPLFALAELLANRGAFEMSATAAQAAIDATSNRSLLAVPRALQRLTYPLPYPDVLESQRQARGVDPLLFAALMRQESTYNPLATSPADARGLTQVLPATGNLLAGRLGYAQFAPDDLYRPVVSLELGAAYLRDALDNVDGRVFPALAAYNAGEGAASRWIDAFGTDDIDLWAERIPYPETSQYVQKVFTYYGRYREIYGAAS